MLQGRNIALISPGWLKLHLTTKCMLENHGKQMRLRSRKMSLPLCCCAREHTKNRGERPAGGPEHRPVNSCDLNMGRGAGALKPSVTIRVPLQWPTVTTGVGRRG